MTEKGAWVSGIDLIRAERKRQRSRKEGGEFYALSHDDDHDKGELASAAAVYATPPEHRARNESAWRAMWPAGWHFKPSPDDRIRELVKAGALIAAEIDRLQRRAS
jgi:hypothetical protein